MSLWNLSRSVWAYLGFWGEETSACKQTCSLRFHVRFRLLAQTWCNCSFLLWRPQGNRCCRRKLDVEAILESWSWDSSDSILSKRKLVLRKGKWKGLVSNLLYINGRVRPKTLQLMPGFCTQITAYPREGLTSRHIWNSCICPWRCALRHVGSRSIPIMYCSLVSSRMV